MAEEYVVPLTELLEAGSHFGHQVRRWNPKMAPYIYAERDGVHIFDLAKTAEGLKKSCEYVRDLVAGGGTLLIVGTKRQAREIVKEEALTAGAPFVSERWLGGSITNWEQIKKSIDKLLEMRGKRDSGEYKKYTKKENVLIAREVERLERFFGGMVALRKIPDAIFVVDTHREIVAVKEARRNGLTVVGIVDTNADPELVDHIIPANDDAVRSIKLVVSSIAKAYADGKRMAEKRSQ
ncbi:MAG: 30S ribosomal protein S2 [Candidatus Chisholmbacteria bacterium RIFCSPLOWO2_01_FULL_50_28]|uniref:Small ribosomal subunit protein uS2 n=1 Tax=Candidatus Chisholmbacteria bacterium RIFCSPHIGHO2_01_FULL_52_32 TaxID=1797591 RepID=A0A1G1VS91_9BACT|nr:MAG: 30S ribosomal protein S2 [Candidatus Chisholmbacteria bacterium RIFCSPHIGHO2_01_FULL_52_32]OGY20386.1 MAG: 30S ribosomal protein S2 [Candidatus Chisholmbacteria bacterium RIFCSPLOWO2_01_FULL_50_28]